MTFGEEIVAKEVDNTERSHQECSSVEVTKKMCLSIREAAEYSGIGIGTITDLLKKPDCPFLLKVGRKRMVKREAFEEFIRNCSEI